MKVAGEIENMENISEISTDYQSLIPPLDLIEKTIEEWTRPLPMIALASPLILVGPSGVGKGRLVRALFKDYARFFRKTITYTSRSMRPEEINGTHYHFITREAMQKGIEENKFLEWSIVHKNLYGISRREWNNSRSSMKIIILEIDIQGARFFKNISSSMGITPKYLFVAPPDINMLRERLVLR